MIYKFKLSGESLDLSKFEVETLFKTKCTRKGNIGICNLSISPAKVRNIAEKSAMIKKIYSKVSVVGHGHEILRDFSISK